MLTEQAGLGSLATRACVSTRPWNPRDDRVAPRGQWRALAGASDSDSSLRTAARPRDRGGVL